MLEPTTTSSPHNSSPSIAKTKREHGDPYGDLREQARRLAEGLENRFLASASERKRFAVFAAAVRLVESGLANVGVRI